MMAQETIIAALVIYILLAPTPFRFKLGLRAGKPFLRVTRPVVSEWKTVAAVGAVPPETP
jgi:hypothetical protein